MAQAVVIPPASFPEVIELVARRLSESDRKTLRLVSRDCLLSFDRTINSLNISSISEQMSSADINHMGQRCQPRLLVISANNGNADKL